MAQNDGEKASMIDLFEELARQDVPIKVEYVTGHWLDVDNSSDLADAEILMIKADDFIVPAQERGYDFYRRSVFIADIYQSGDHV